MSDENRNERLTPSIEDYLEAIYVLDKKERGVRSIDVAEHLHVAKPSVNRALKSLVESGMIEQERYSLIYLTDDGRKMAKEIYHRHRTIKEFLMNVLLLDEHQAEDEACKIEHVVSDLTIERLHKVMIACGSSQNEETLKRIFSNDQLDD